MNQPDYYLLYDIKKSFEQPTFQIEKKVNLLFSDCMHSQRNFVTFVSVPYFAISKF